MTIVLILFAAPAPAQTQLWMKQFGTGADDNGCAAAPDNAGGIYTGGETWGSLGGPYQGMRDAWVRRVDAAGAELWTVQFGSGKEESVQAAASAPGGVFIAGFTDGSHFGQHVGFVDAWVARLDDNGTKLWSRQLATSSSDWAWWASSDGFGGVLVAGHTNGALGVSPSGGEDAWIARLDGAGNVLWIKQVGTSSNEFSTSCAADGQGGAYLSGSTYGSLDGINAGDVDAWVARIDGSGGLLWVRQVGTSTQDLAYATATSGADGVFVAGTTSGNLAGPSNGVEDAWLAHYDASGNLKWIRQLGTSQYDHVEVASADGTGGVFVAGPTGGSLGGPNVGGADSWAARFDSLGNLLWKTQVGSPSYDYMQMATTTVDGRLAIGGSTTGNLGGPTKGATDAWVALYDGSCSSGTPYCTPSLTSLPACQAGISGVGSPSLAAPNSYLINSGSIPGGNLGICFFNSTGTASTPFGTLGGKICMQGPIFRTTPKPSGGSAGSCNGSYTFRLTDLIAASPIVTSGAAIHAQVWARDPANQDGFLLSDGIEVTVCP